MGKFFGAAIALLLSIASADASNCYIREYQTIATIQSKVAQIAPDVGTTVDQTPVAIGSAASSAPFNAKTTLVRLICGANASFVIGASPQTATTSNSYLATGIPEYFAVAPGQIVSFVSNASP